MIVAVLLFLLCVVQNVNAEDVPAGSELPRLVDDADILTDSEEKELNQQLDTVSEEQECDVIIVTVDSLNGKTVEEYADDYYDYGGFGVGKKASGVLLLYYMDGPGQSGGECYISTSGTMITLLTDERIETILDDVYGNLGNRDFAAASQIFLEDVSDYVKQGVESGQYTYDRDTGEIVRYRSIRWYEAVAAVVIAGILAGSVCMDIKKRYAMKQSSREAANSLQAYRADCAFHFSVTGDKLVNQFVRSIPIPRNTSGGSGRGHSGGSSSGRSTVHTSSSGRSHGGGGRRF